MMLSSPKQYGIIHMEHFNEGLANLPSSTSWLSQCTWALIKAGKITGQGEGTLLQASKACSKVPCVVALPASHLVITKLFLPIKRNSQRRTAIPLAVQNQLACNAKELHWSWQAQGQNLQLIGIDRSSLNAIQCACTEVQLTPKWIIADALHLGGSSSLWKLMITPNYWMLNYGTHLAYRGEITSRNSVDDAMVWLQKAYDEAQKIASDGPLSIDVIGTIPSQLKQWFTTNTIVYHNISAQNPMGRSAALLASYVKVKSCINLLPKNSQLNWVPKINWQLWRLPYVLAMTLSLVGLGHLWLTNQNLTQQLEQSVKQGKALFRRTLPNERLIEPLSQLESLLLQAQEPKQKALFLPLLYEFNQQRKRQGTTAATSDPEAKPNSTFKRLTFVDGTLKVDFFYNSQGRK